MARTLVAVGTSSDADMFLTTAAAAPRSTCASSPSAAGVAGFASAALGLAGVTSVLAAGGCWRRAVPLLGGLGLPGVASAFGGAGSALAGAPLSAAASVRARDRFARCGGLRTSVRRRCRSTCLRLIRGSSRPGIRANSGRPRRGPRGTCGTSPRPTTRSARMVKVNCSRQLLASILLLRQASARTPARLSSLPDAVTPHFRRLKASASAAPDCARRQQAH